MDDVDAALEGLTESELAELNEIVDPENELGPTGERQQSTTTKKPTGAYDRSKLMEHMKLEASQSLVGKDWVAFDGKKKGKVFREAGKVIKPSAGKKQAGASLSTGDLELDALLSQVTDNDMDELADMVGAYGLSSQSAAQARDAGEVCRPIVKAAVPVVRKDEMDSVPQTTDVEESIRLLCSDSASLHKLNLNNHEEVTSAHLHDMCRALLTNKHLTHLQLVNTGVRDEHAKILADSLDYNRSLKVLNLESNRITGEGVKLLVAGLKENTTLEELRLNNQLSQIGSQAESELADMLEHNRTLRKIGYSFKCAGPRARIDRLLLRNNDLARQERLSNTQVSYS